MRPATLLRLPLLLPLLVSLLDGASDCDEEVDWDASAIPEQDASLDASHLQL
jgi:hypothetical protein